MIALGTMKLDVSYDTLENIISQLNIQFLAYPVLAFVKRMCRIKFSGFYVHVNIKIVMVINELFQYDLRKGGQRTPFNADCCFLLLEHNGYILVKNHNCRPTENPSGGNSYYIPDGCSS